MKKTFKFRISCVIIVMILFSGHFLLQAASPTYINVKPINFSFFGNTYEGWNKVVGLLAGDSIANLIDQEGNLTNISMKITERFGGTNSNGSEATTTSMNLPKEVSKFNFVGNTGTFYGGIYPKATFVISSLYPDIEYDFAVFASRMSATDNRETYYKFSGIESGDTTLYLNPSNNTSNIVEAFKVKPDSNGKITVEVGPGPNNNNPTGFFHLTAMRMIPRIVVETVPFTKQLNVSFVSAPLDVTWNVLGDFRENASATHLRDIDGNFTDISLVVTERFNNINTGGSEVTDTEMNMPREVSKASYFGNTQTWTSIIVPKSTVKFTSLDPSMKYDFAAFSSRMSSTDNRETYFKFTGAVVADKIVYLNASNNSNTIAKAEGILPNSSGEIFIEVGPGPNNDNSTGFYYVNSLTIKPNLLTTGVIKSQKSKINLYPNPFETVLNVFVKDKEDQIKLMSIDGKEVISFDRLTPNSLNSLNMSSLSSGVYILKSGNDKSIVIKK